jgi:hypothetical protein
LCQLDSILKTFGGQVALVAQEVGHISSCGFLLWISHDSGFFGHQKFFTAFVYLGQASCNLKNP